jgi:hypothetical protein
VIGPVWEHRPQTAPIELEEGAQVPIASVLHGLMVVMSPDCDLIWDFKVRFLGEDAPIALEPAEPDVEHQASGMPHVLACDAFLGEDIRHRVPEGSKGWSRVGKNQDERYHHLPSSPFADAEEIVLPDLFLDFKKSLAFPTSFLYEGLRTGDVRRTARVPPIYLHDLVHRFYGFLSRVAVPS